MPNDGLTCSRKHDLMHEIMEDLGIDRKHPHWGKCCSMLSMPEDCLHTLSENIKKLKTGVGTDVNFDVGLLSKYKWWYTKEPIWVGDSFFRIYPFCIGDSVKSGFVSLIRHSRYSTGVLLDHKDIIFPVDIFHEIFEPVKDSDLDNNLEAGHKIQLSIVKTSFEKSTYKRRVRH